MRSRQYIVGMITVAMVVPFFAGCSTLGIATTDELTATDDRLTATNTRLNTVEKSATDMQASLAQMSADMDSLNARFARAKEWLETMNLDTIAEEASKASQAALAIQTRNKAFLASYIAWLKAQQDLIATQLTALEAALEEIPDSSGGNAKPADSGDGGGDGGDDDSGDGGGD